MTRHFTLRNTATEWGLVAICLHWLLAVMIAGQLVLGWLADEARVSPQKLDLFVWHKSVGITILLLVILRLVWRLANRTPSTPPGLAPWEHRAARLSHALLYLLMVSMPVTGWWVSDTSRIPFRIYWHIPAPDLLGPDRQASELAAGVHQFVAILLIAVVVVHTFAALRHHILLRDDTLLRMLPLRRKPGDRV